jgi:GAF domain-containing protein
MATGDFGLQFYAAAPLTTSDGFKIGAVCIVDKVPRVFSESDQEMLQSLAAIVMDEIEEA